MLIFIDASLYISAYRLSSHALSFFLSPPLSLCLSLSLYIYIYWDTLNISPSLQLIMCDMTCLCQGLDLMTLAVTGSSVSDNAYLVTPNPWKRCWTFSAHLSSCSWLLLFLIYSLPWAICLQCYFCLPIFPLFSFWLAATKRLLNLKLEQKFRNLLSTIF